MQLPHPPERPDKSLGPECYAMYLRAYEAYLRATEKVSEQVAKGMKNAHYAQVASQEKAAPEGAKTPFQWTKSSFASVIKSSPVAPKGVTEELATAPQGVAGGSRNANVAGTAAKRAGKARKAKSQHHRENRRLLSEKIASEIHSKNPLSLKSTVYRQVWSKVKPLTTKQIPLGFKMLKEHPKQLIGGLLSNVVLPSTTDEYRAMVAPLSNLPSSATT